jgi:hypothetical protein
VWDIFLFFLTQARYIHTKLNFPHVVSLAGDLQDTRRRRFLQAWHQQLGQQEVTQVVCLVRQFMTVLGDDMLPTYKACFYIYMYMCVYI